MQCHRSYIINLLHVKSMKEKEFYLKNGKDIPIGRMYKAGAQEAFRACFWNSLQSGSV